MGYKDKEDMRRQSIKYLNTESGFLISNGTTLKKE